MVRCGSEDRAGSVARSEEQQGMDPSQLAQKQAPILDGGGSHFQLADRAHLAELVMSSHDAIIAHSLDGKIASWNPAAEAMFGFRPDEVIGKPAAILSPANHRNESAAMFDRLMAGEEAVRYETIRLHKDGRELFVSITVSPIRNGSGNIIGTSAIMRDITDRHEAQKRIQRLQDDLVHLSRWNIIGMMASTLAHDLNQPLAAAMNYVSASARTLANNNPPSSPRVVEFLNKAIEEIRNASGIIRSLRRLIDKREVRRKSENLNSVIEEVLSLGISDGLEDLKLVVNTDPELPFVMMDRAQIAQVIINLVRNAVEAMRETPNKELTINTSIGGNGLVTFSIADTGPGLAPDIAGKLFQPFITTKTNGLGIGLNICKSIIESHDGHIWFEPSPPCGVMMRFELPTLVQNAYRG